VHLPSDPRPSLAERGPLVGGCCVKDSWKGCLAVCTDLLWFASSPRHSLVDAVNMCTSRGTSVKGSWKEIRVLYSHPHLGHPLVDPCDPCQSREISVEVGWKKCERTYYSSIVDRAGSDVSRCPGSSDESLGDWHSYPSRTQEAEKAQLKERSRGLEPGVLPLMAGTRRCCQPHGKNEYMYRGLPGYILVCVIPKAG